MIRSAVSPDRLWLYAFLAKFRWLKSYKSKILLIAFVGTHIPLLALLVCFITSTALLLSVKIQVLAIALVATLIGTGVTLFALHALLAPVSLASSALRYYQRNQQLLNLPTAFFDEVGTLMADTSETLQKLDELIRYMENYDNLTGLPNSALFRDRLHQILLQGTSAQLVAVFAFRLNNFKDINNTLGCRSGEILLRAVAQQLSRCIGQDAVLCRGGSDEFWVVQTLTTIEEADQIARTLLKGVSEPFRLGSTDLRTSASVGIALHPIDADQVDVLLGNAGTAMAAAKRQAGSSYQFYSTELGSDLQERLELETALHHALEREELYLLYQPQISASTGHPVGVEALIRWNHPTLGLISPARFIPIAESSGLILAIGEWALRTACAQGAQWLRAGLPPLVMSVNLSAIQFKQPHLVECVSQIIDETGLPAHSLKLELTESLVMENIEPAIKILQRLHDLGITIALDDFGTSYSSLNYLTQLPLDTLKIDQSFVRNLESSAQDATIVRTIISLAHSLDLMVIAEGVETLAQLEVLQANGCHQIQGYLISRPISAEAIVQFLKSSLSPKVALAFS